MSGPILRSQVPAFRCLVQVFSTRFGFGIFLYPHPHQNSRTRSLIAETGDLKNASPANHPVSGFPLS